MAFIELNVQAVGIFIAFMIFLLLFYKLFKVAIKMILIALIAFSFPWIVQYFNLPLPITASIDTGLYFAGLGTVIFLVFTFSKAIIKFLKKITGH